MKLWIIGTSLMLSILLCVYVIGCQPQFYTPATYTGKQLIFGNGGGFTGVETEYILLANGQLFSRKSRNSEPEAVKILSKAVTRQLFEEALQLPQIEFNHPGNIYFYIQLQNTNSLGRITWGDQLYKVPEEAENLYQLLMVSIKD